MPGYEKTSSTTIAPATIDPSESAIRVTSGSIAFRSACLHTIAQLRRPLARAVST